MLDCLRSESKGDSFSFVGEADRMGWVPASIRPLLASAVDMEISSRPGDEARSVAPSRSWFGRATDGGGVFAGEDF